LAKVALHRPNHQTFSRRRTASRAMARWDLRCVRILDQKPRLGHKQGVTASRGQ
jgi:hypothetical protein